jgi:serine/threonine protein kinase
LEEVQVTAQLDHPAIAPVHDLGFDHDGTPFCTMRLVKGRDLREIIRMTQDGVDSRNLTRLIEVLVKVCQAIAYAHGKGVIHRDLK